MICILHGYLLEGSGSNLWTRSIIDALCGQGETVHLMAQENHPERYDFITAALRYGLDGTVQTWHTKASACAGRCILHKPDLGDTLPVYVWDEYEEYSRVVPMVDLDDAELDAYIERNVAVLRRVVAEHGITVLHANHSVLMSVVAQRVSEETGIPYAVMPHGSALEFAVKRDDRMRRLAERAFEGARLILVIGEELRARVRRALPDVGGLEQKFVELNLGVNTSEFEPAPRERRPALIEQLGRSLESAPRGRKPAQGEALRQVLGAGGTLEAALLAGRGYDAKSPDAELEAKLATVAWEAEDTVLFVGRLISSKGIQAVIAALPMILEQRPDLRLLVVGHGPLREPLEAMLWGLEHGDMALVRQIVSRGRALEGAPEGESAQTSLTECAAYYRTLEERGQLERYWTAARTHVRAERVIFTGYLRHARLRYLFPCCDVAIFPSVVREAGPLVFLEALASGAFPLGTYVGGMAASIDSAGDVVPAEVADAMKLSADPEQTVADIVRQVPRALDYRAWRMPLYELARERYDWRNVARRLKAELEAI